MEHASSHAPQPVHSVEFTISVLAIAFSLPISILPLLLTHSVLLSNLYCQACVLVHMISDTLPPFLFLVDIVPETPMV